MSFVTDIRAVSESAIEQLAGRFDDLPRPLLAAIGAGDLAVEQWAALRESVRDQFVGANGVDAAAFTTDLSGKAQQAASEYAGKAQQAATELPQRAQTIAVEVTESIQAFAAQLPAQAQGLMLRLPEKIAELSGDLTAEAVRDTMNAYTELVGMIYGGLADRGERTWSKVRSSSLRPGTVVDAAPETAKKAPATPATRAGHASGAAASGGAAAAAAQPSARPHMAAKVTTAAPKTARAARSAATEAPTGTTRKTAPKTATTIKPADGPTGTSKPRAPRKATAAPAAKPARTHGAVKARPKRDTPTATPAPKSHPAGEHAVGASGVTPHTKRPPATRAEKVGPEAGVGSGHPRPGIPPKV